MKNLNRKPGGNAGFTLVEMLIVVAIIAILVAVSIPLVSSSLENARDNTDLANERAAKAAATMVFLGVGKVDDDQDYTPGTKLYYDAEAGKLVTDPDIAKNKNAYDCIHRMLGADHNWKSDGKCGAANT